MKSLTFTVWGEYIQIMSRVVVFPILLTIVVLLGPSNAWSQRDKNPVDDVWSKRNTIRIGGLLVVRRCIAKDPKNDRFGECRLSIVKGKRTVWHTSIEYARAEWLRFGLFQFLRGKNKQLIIHRYSGGAHCCYDYNVFDIEAGRLRNLYDSSRYDSANEIGNELMPVDINRDGTFEFYQDVMAFDYMGFAGHASATFPPAIFSFDRRQRKFVISNKRFAAFVLERMKLELAGLRNWQQEHNDRSKDSSSDMISSEQVNEVAVRDKFLYMVYAGKELEAWPEFLRNYRTANGAGYQDEFRDKFVNDFKELFKADPTYRSIYGRK